MSYGYMVGGVRRTRAYAGESGAGFAKTATVRKAAAPVVAKVNVEATFDGIAYTLVVEADGQRATVTDVKPVELANEVARVLGAVTKALRNGDLSKHRQRDSSPLGIGTPRPNRDSLTR